LFIFNRDYAAFGLGEPFKNFTLPIVCSPKATFNILKVPVVFFPQFKTKFDTDTVVSSPHILAASKLQMEQHALVVNRISVRLMPSRK